MIMLGIILMLIAVVIGLGSLWMTTSNNEAVSFTVGPVAVNVSPAVLLVIGMGTIALLWLGAWLAGFGTKRTIGKRRERKELEREAREHERALAETQAKLGQERESAAEAERRREEERIREEERLREARLAAEADRRRTAGHEDDVRRLAAERDDRHGHDRGSRDAHAAGGATARPDDTLPPRL